MRNNIKLVLFLINFKSIFRMNLAQKFSFGDSEDKQATISRYVFWPNATIPFYIVPEHFDQEQSTSIMSTLALFAFKTCLKFVPALAPPTRTQHVLVVANPGGVKKCVLDTAGHPMDEPHTLIVGYNCLHSPHIDMLLMKALGFPFEHTRASRDLFIDVQFENIDPSDILSAGKMALTIGHNIKLYENIFIETNLQSSDYDAVVLLLYPEELSVPIPRDVGSFINASAKVDKHLYKAATVWNCDYVSGGRLVLSPTGQITPYHDVRVIKEAAKKGVLRAMDAGAKKPLIVVPKYVEFPDGQLVAILGALEALYVPLQMRERENVNNFIRIGFHAEEKLTSNFEKVVRNAIALERSRILARDIGGGDPERMAPAKIVEYVKNSFAPCNNITINVIDDEEIIAQEYPLLAAVSRAANRVDRHKARVVEIVYNPSDPSRISETVMLVGKGVTYDTGGADIKISGKMAGMSRDKCGAAAVAGFLKACSILKPTHLKVIGVLCLCRNSVGEDSYVADELLVSKSGKTVRVTNTDAEGRFAMADSVFKLSQLAGKELNPHIYTIATLTGHARACYGDYSASMDNHSAKATNHSTRLQFSGSRMGEGIEVSVVRPEDLAVNVGKCRGDDLLQVDMDAKARHHQLAAGFLIKVGGLEDVNVKYTHLDIAGAAGSPPCEPTAVPILSLCHIHKILL